MNTNTEQFLEIPVGLTLKAKIDACDYDRFSRYTWRPFTRKGLTYAVRSSGGKFFFMHREVMGLKKGDGVLVDHLNPAETLDNRRSNLRLASYGQNRSNSRIGRNNTSGFKGVSKYGDKFKAFIKKDGKTLYLGMRDNPESAAALYRDAALKMYGEFCRF